MTMLQTVGILVLGLGLLLILSAVKGLKPKAVLESVVRTGRAT